MTEEEKKSSLKDCLEESNNPRMQNYVKILDTPGISTFEWIHRTQEELMDGIVYLEKLKEMLSMNMRELDAAREESIKRNERKKEEERREEEVNEIKLNSDDIVVDSKVTVTKKKKVKKKKVSEDVNEKYTD
jgi:hypothetical protein